MKKHFLRKVNIFLLQVLLLMSVGACKDEDHALLDENKPSDEHVTIEEEQLKQINSDISAISTIINAMQDKAYVVSVTETEEGSQIEFSNEETVTIKKSEESEGIPVIGVKEWEGKYYWVQIFDGVKVWLTDQDGNKRPVAGKDAVTPILKVNTDGCWLVSYDGGITFGLLTEEQGNPIKITGSGKYAFFSDMKVKDTEVVLTLTDGMELRIAINEVEGVSTPARKVSENYDIIYQYSEGVIVLNEKTQVYIERVEEDSILFFSSTTPANILPEVGDIISSKVTEKTPYGLGNKVISRTEEGDLIKCVTSVAPLDEIFEVLEVTSSFSLVDLVEEKGGFYDDDGNYYEYTVEEIEDVIPESGVYWGQDLSRATAGTKKAMKIPLNKYVSGGSYADVLLSLGGVITFNKSKENDTFEFSLEPSFGISGEIGVRADPLLDEDSFERYARSIISLLKRRRMIEGELDIAGVITLRPFVDVLARVKGKGYSSFGVLSHNFSFKCGWTDKGWFIQNTSRDFPLENKFSSLDVHGKAEVGPEVEFTLGFDLYTKDSFTMLNAKPELMIGANLGMDSDRKGNGAFDIGEQTVTLDLTLDVIGETDAEFFNHVLSDDSVKLQDVLLIQKEASIFPKFEKGSLSVTQTNREPLTFNAQYTLSEEGGLAKLLEGKSALRVDKDGTEVYHLTADQEPTGRAVAALNFELTGLERDVTYTAVPCIYIGDTCYEWEGVDFSSEDNIVGQWGMNASASVVVNGVEVSEIEWVDVLTFKADGTYSYESNPLRKVLYWTDSNGSHSRIPYAYCSGTYVFNESQKMLRLDAESVTDINIVDGVERADNSVLVTNLFGRSSTYKAYLSSYEGELRLIINHEGWQGSISGSSFFWMGDGSQTESRAVSRSLLETEKGRYRTGYQLQDVR